VRIALVTHTDRRAGGVETYVESLGSALVSLGHDVALWHETKGPADRDEIDLPLEVERTSIATNLAAAYSWRPDVLVVNGLENVELEGQLLARVPSVFVAHNFYGTCISGTKTWSLPHTRACDRSFGWECLGHYFPRRCGGLNPLTMARLYRREAARGRQLRRGAFVVTLSSYMREEYLRNGFDAARVRHVPFGPERVEEPARPATSTSPGEPYTLICIGRLERTKGIHLLLAALPIAQRTLARPLAVHIVGDGSERRALEHQARKVLDAGASITINFTGWVSAAVRDLHLQSADLLIVPSLWPEPLGLVGIEAGGYGVPAAAFDIGGIGDWLIDGETGALAPADPPTAEGLARAIVTCLSDGECLARMRDRARAHARQFSPLIHAAGLIRLFEEELEPVARGFSPAGKKSDAGAMTCG